ncbi:MAG: GTPase Era [Chitinivibrionales bacterium]|nr:GTPase Era [Chitinivibrionales bacterium]
MAEHERPEDALEIAPGFRCGMMALVGRPNSGKSTLINTVIGEQLCLVTPLPQTTRHNLRGIYNSEHAQLVFVDTPGIHGTGRKLNQAMVVEARGALTDEGLDLVGYVVDLGREFGEEEDTVAEMVAAAAVPVIVVFNKLDRCDDPQRRMEEFRTRYPSLANTRSVALIATSEEARTAFLDVVVPLLPEGLPLFPPDELTDQNMRFFAAECLRKGIILSTQKEVPHATCVEILEYRETPQRHVIEAVIHVETAGQKGIIIGKGGKAIGHIRRVAEREMARLADAPVSYHCHVKISPKWRDKPGFLRAIGYRI